MSTSTTATKSGSTLQSSTARSAGAATTVGSALDLSTSPGGGAISATITNGATGPTVGCDLIVEVSHDNSTWVEFSRQTASIASNAVTGLNVDIPAPYLYARPSFSGNTGQSVTVAAYGHKITNLTTA